MTRTDSSDRSIRVAVVADDECVRASLQHLLISGDHVVVVRSLVTGPCPTTPPARLWTDVDVIVIDLPARSLNEPDVWLQGLPRGISLVVLGDGPTAARAADQVEAHFLDKAQVADKLLTTISAAATA